MIKSINEEQQKNLLKLLNQLRKNDQQIELSDSWKNINKNEKT